MQRYTLFNKTRNFSDIFFHKIKIYNYFYKIIRKICTVSNKTILEVECYIYYIMYVYNNVWCMVIWSTNEKTHYVIMLMN